MPIWDVLLFENDYWTLVSWGRRTMRRSYAGREDIYLTSFGRPLVTRNSARRASKAFPTLFQTQLLFKWYLVHEWRSMCDLVFFPRYHAARHQTI